MESLEKIVTASEKCLDMAQSIATATDQQSTAINEVSSNIELVTNVFGTSSREISQINISSDELARTANELMNLVSWFKTESPVVNESNNEAVSSIPS